MKPALQLAASLRKMASSPLPTDDEQADMREAAELLEKIEGFAQHLKNEAETYRALSRGTTPTGRVHCAARGSVYDEEARRLREILGKTEAAHSHDFDDEPTKERKPASPPSSAERGER